MLEYTLKNGRTLRIKGRKFEIDSDTNGDMVVTPIEPQSPFISSPDYNFDSITEPAIDPEPAPVIRFDDLPKKEAIKKAKMDKVSKNKTVQDELNKGESKFVQFINIWRENFGVEGSEQPDRAKLMTSTMNQYSKYILKFIKHTGGLTNAILLATDDLSPEDLDDRLHARLISENIAQVGSILYPAISELLEYPFELEP